VSGHARRSFLENLTFLRKSLDSPLVSAADAVGSFLRRGLTIVSYNLLEAFITSRLDEVAEYVNSGVAHFGDLPERLQRAASFDVLRFANSRVQRASWDLASSLAFTTDIGASLAASSGPLKLSSLTWQWPGSNMTAEDVRRALRLFHVESPWSSVEQLASRVGATMPDPKTTLIGLLRERNNCAHESSYQVSNLWIRAVPNQLLIIGMGVDISISVASHELHIGKRDFLDDENWMKPDRVKFRLVQERNKEWAETLEGNIRAAHVSTDKEALIKGAINTARGRHQVVVVKDRTLQVVDWIYPELP
jgi:hypothetical protein